MYRKHSTQEPYNKAVQSRYADANTEKTTLLVQWRIGDVCTESLFLCV